ncbi:unnamed protein product, partial [Mesorhabditis belari]|uniref:Uncharacterized protein n=1 Tax=Mesorhabditis belari TaxID=2138241 RepID=A0AAF3FK40_9BILA
MLQQQQLNEILRCFDVPLFLINGQPPVQNNCDLMPIGQQFPNDYSQVLYFCTMKVGKQREIFVSSINTTFNDRLDYAISFRVQQWVNVSMSVLVFPASASPHLEQIDQILVRRNVDLTCLFLGHYLAFFGSDPGLLMKNPIKLGLGSAYQTLRSRASVTTIFTTDDCTFCLYTRTENELYPVTIGYPELLTSHNYPWIFDDPSEFPDCQIFHPEFFSLKPDEKLELSVISVENGNLTLYTSNELVCVLAKFPQKFSLVANSTEKQIFEGNCIKFEFCSLPLNEHSGFEIEIGRPVVEPQDKKCEMTIELTSKDPQAIIHVYVGVCILQRLAFALQPICTPSIMPFLFNGRSTQMGNWTIRKLNSGHSVTSTRITLGEKVYLSPAGMITFIYQSAISFLASGTAFEEIDFYLWPSEEQLPLNLLNHFDMVEHGRWVTVKMQANYKWIDQRNRDRSTIDQRSEYRWIIGPPAGIESHPERELALYNDDQPFVEQFLFSDQYSFDIPAGCAPGLAINTSAECLELHERKQKLCDGQIFVASNGYGTPAKLEKNEDFDGANDVNYTITCDSWPVNITIEVTSIGNGKLSYEFLTLAGNDVLITPKTKQAFNDSASAVRGITIYWNVTGKLLTMNGLLMKVHFTKSDPHLATTSEIKVQRVKRDSSGSSTTPPPYTYCYLP